MRRALIICLALVMAVLAVFWQVHAHDFVNFDDQEYITDNPHVRAGVTLKGIAWAFTTFHEANWHPLTWLSHMLDCQLFGLNPTGHHLSSVLLHLANTLLLLFLLHRMTGALWRSSLVAALFAIHPLHVESVAWVAERKDVLSTLFWLLTMWAYLSYVRRPARGRYLLALVIFACGLMAKPMLVTLPFVLLLLDYWPLARMRRGLPHDVGDLQPHAVIGPGQHPVSFLRLFWEKVPFLALSVVSSVVTFIAQSKGGAVRTLQVFPLESRAANCMVSYVGYIKMMLWPQNLAVFYPHPEQSLSWWQVAGAGLMLTCMTLLVVRGARRYPYLITGWLWYLGTLVPVIGLVQVGLQAMADRYTYIPLVGLFIMLAWGPGEIPIPWAHRRAFLGMAAGALLLTLMACSWAQLHSWKDGKTLWEHALQVTDGNYLAQNNLGEFLEEHQLLEEAICHYSLALEMKPDFAAAHNNLGIALSKQGRLPEAIGHFSKAIDMIPQLAPAYNNMAEVLARLGEVEKAINVLNRSLKTVPNFPVTHCNLAELLYRQGDVNSAIEHYQKAVGIDPTSFRAQRGLGVILAREGRIGEAVGHLSQALDIEPDHADLHNGLGALLVRQGRLAEAISHFSEALKRSPDDPVFLNNMGEALDQQGNVEGAIQHFSRALGRKPDYAEAHNNLAGLFFQQKKFNEAIIHYEKVLETRPDWPEVHNNLGVALAHMGRLSEAARHLSEALRLTPDYVEARNSLRLVLKEMSESRRKPAPGKNQ